MTAYELAKLSPEEKRIAIARACPAIICNSYGQWFYASHDKDNWNPCLHNDPLHDLNACAEFEKTLNDSQWNTYALNLESVVSDTVPGESEHSRDYSPYHATTAQRGDAFLLTI